jgi:hypothetical protein
MLRRSHSTALTPHLLHATTCRVTAPTTAAKTIHALFLARRFLSTAVLLNLSRYSVLLSIVTLCGERNAWTQSILYDPRINSKCRLAVQEEVRAQNPLLSHSSFQKVFVFITEIPSTRLQKPTLRLDLLTVAKTQSNGPRFIEVQSKIVRTKPNRL